MIGTIVRHEWMQLSRERLLWVALPLYLLLLCYGIVTGTGWARGLERNVTQASALAEKGFADKLARIDDILAGRETATYFEEPRVAAPLARYKGFAMAVKPPAPTAAIAIGQSDVLPSYLKVQWKPMFRQSNTDEPANPTNLATGAFDLSFVLVYLYPLLIIALAFNLLSAEREQGTQALLLSQPVSLRAFVAAKLIARAALVVGAAVLLSVAGLVLADPAVLAGGWRIVLLALLLVAYGLFWFGLAVLVNACGWRSATNAMALVAAWVALVLVLPGCLNLVARALHPLPSRIEMVQALRRGDRLAEERSGFQRAYRADLLRRSEEEAVEASNADFYAKALPLEAQGEAIARPIFTRFAQAKAAQNRFAERAGLLSPAVVMQAALADLADQGTASFRHFDAQVEAFHQRWRAYFLPPVLANRLLTRDEFVAIPRFRYVAEAGGQVAGRVGANLGVLLLFGTAVLAAGFARLRRYPAAAR